MRNPSASSRTSSSTPGKAALGFLPLPGRSLHVSFPTLPFGSLNSLPLLSVKIKLYVIGLWGGLGNCGLQSQSLERFLWFLSVSVFGNLLQSRPCFYYMLQFRAKVCIQLQVHGEQAVLVFVQITVWKQGVCGECVILEPNGGLMKLKSLRLPEARGSSSSSSHCHFSHRLKLSNNLDLGVLFISLSRPENIWEEGGGGIFIRQATSFHPAES